MGAIKKRRICIIIVRRQFLSYREVQHWLKNDFPYRNAENEFAPSLIFSSAVCSISDRVGIFYDSKVALSLESSRKETACGLDRDGG